ncbi:MAG: hypothetical protein QM820_25500 [Minicystis sp.]
MRPLAALPVLFLAAFARPAAAAGEAKQVAGDAAPPPPADAAPAAAAQDPAAEALPEPIDDTSFLDRFVLETGRTDPKPPDPGALRFNIHGEYQLRYQAQSNLRLQPPLGQPSVNTLGQNQYLYHWLRVGLRLDIFDKIALVGQIDVPRGMIVGDTTQFVTAARDAFAETKWYEVHPRYLYLEYTSPVGVFRLGQQGSYWGMGILANDGDHDTLFGDHRRGAIVERFLYATTPFGKGTPFYIALGADLVFRDNTASLLDGDKAFQGVAAVGYRTKHAEVGVYGVGRHMERGGRATDQLTPFTDTLTVGVVDVTARFDVPVPGARAFAYGAVEMATIFGSTTFVRSAYQNNIDPTAPRQNETVRSFGGAATLGAVRVAGEGKDRWGQIMGEVEIGYASGDADPYDGVTKRFTFDENHHVGLILFDHVMRWQTARAATIAQDPAIVARAAPGLELLPSNGAVFGAQYINPRFVIRPRRWVDLKGGVVIAQTTADFVDPFHAGALGSARNYDGGRPDAHDLGVELDAGANFRIQIDPGSTIQAGFEGGVLFPGHAFDDAHGTRMPNQYLVNVKLGLQY